MERDKKIFSLRVVIASLKDFTSAESFLSKWSTSLKAVFFPIPGNLENSFTAFSNNNEEKIISQNYEIWPFNMPQDTYKKCNSVIKLYLLYYPNWPLYLRIG